MSGYGKDVVIKSNSVFLKVESGHPQIIRLLDESPTEQFKHSIRENDQFKTVGCSGKGCSYCEKGPAKQRFVTNIYNQKLKRVQLFEYGAAIAIQFQSIAESLKEQDVDLMNVDLEVSATGEKLTKKYNVIPRMNSASLPDGLELIEIKDALPF